MSELDWLTLIPKVKDFCTVMSILWVMLAIGISAILIFYKLIEKENELSNLINKHVNLKNIVIFNVIGLIFMFSALLLPDRKTVILNYSAKVLNKIKQTEGLPDMLADKFQQLLIEKLTEEK